MKNRITIFILLTISHFTIGQSTILWKVTDTINNKTSFIVGTFHQFGNSFVDSIPEIRESLFKSEMAIFESIDTIESTREIIESRKSSSELERRLNKKELIKLKQIAKEWKVDIYKLKPLEIRWKLQQEFQRKICKTTKLTDQFDHFDNYLIYLSKEKNIQLLGLETDSLQLNLIERNSNYPDWKKERKNISVWIDQLTTTNPNMNNCIFADKYRKFDLDYEFEKECKTDVLILERNNNWMKVIPDILRSKNTFIAVGYYHLRNKCGILEQLKNEGFMIEPIKIKPTTTVLQH